jgi:hypothetical protein
MRNADTRNRGRGFALTVIIIGAAALSSCGKATETGLEKVIEQQSGGNVDIDTDGGGFSIETEDGSMTVDADGNFVITDENGETITGNAGADDESFNVESEDGSFSAGATTELPDAWPSDVPTPDGLAITSAFVISETTADGMSVNGTVDGEGFLDDYGTELEAAGFETTSEYKAEGTVNRLYSSDAWNVGVVYFEDESGNQVVISLYSAG